MSVPAFAKLWAKAFLLLTLYGAAISSALGAELTAGRLLLYANQNPPAACLTLSADPAPGAEHFVQVLQEGRALSLPVSLGTNEICVHDLSHGQSYELVLKAGLPGAEGRLSAEVKQSLTVPQAKEMLAFKDGARLPLSDKTYLEMVSTNLQEADVYLYKLTLRDLSALDLDLLLKPRLNVYELPDLIYEHASFISHERLSLKGTQNESLTTKLDLSSALPESSGLIVILVKDPSLNLGLPGDDTAAPGTLYDLSRTDKAFAAKLVNVSDLMLTAYQGEDLFVTVRSLKDAKPVSGAQVTLLAHSNAILGFAESTRQGTVRFAPELLTGSYADEPWALIAEREGDITLLPIYTGALNLSEKNVNPAAPGNLKLYALTSRGIYRPGEEVNLTLMVRDEAGAASAAPLTLVLQSPQGQELERRVVQGDALGTYYESFKLSKAAARGSWRLRFLEGDRELHALTFAVSDFVPSSLSLSVQAPERLTAGTPAELTLKADFNYGAPAAGLAVSAAAQLTPSNDPLPGLEDYHFGPAQSARRALPLPLEPLTTDDKGEAKFALDLPALPYAAELNLEAQVYDLNQESQSSSRTLQVAAAVPLIGIRQLEDNRLEVIYKDADGHDLTGELHYTVYLRERHYQYVREQDAWHYRRQELKRPLLSGTLMVQGEAQLPLTLSAGSYLIEVSAPPEAANTAEAEDQAAALSAESAFEFTFGSAGALEDADNPERLTLYSDKDSYKPGETVKLSFTSPFAGEASLILAAKTVLDSQNFSVKQGLNELELEFKAEYAPGVKALLSLYAPLQERPLLSVRAIGLQNLTADNSAAHLKLKAELPDVIKPNTELTIPVSIESEEPLVLQAYLVDSGILSLTNYAQPDAFYQIFGPRALYLKVTDSYRGLVRSADPYSQGYGAAAESYAKALSALSVIPRTITALALPPVRVENGRTELNFKVPDFAGELTLMLSAASAQGIGSYSDTLKVRAEAVVSAALPRFMRQGDKLTVALNLNNVSSSASAFKAEVKCTGALSCTAEGTLHAAQGSSASLKIPLQALSAAEQQNKTAGADGGEGNAGSIGSVKLKVSAVEGSDFVYAATLNLTVLPPYPPVMQSVLTRLKPGESAQLNFKEPFGKVTSAAAVLSSLPGVNAPVLLAELKDAHPASSAELALKVLTLSRAADSGEPYPAAALQLIVDELVSRQNASGGWSAYGADWGTDPYVSALVTGLLADLKAQGLAVPEGTLKSAFAALDKAGSSGSDAARALNFLTRLKFTQASLSDLYYFAASDEVQSPQALAFLTACFAAAGDSAQREAMVKLVLTRWQELYALEGRLSALPAADGTPNKERQLLLSRRAELISSPTAGLIHDGYLILAAAPELALSSEGTELITRLGELTAARRFHQPSEISAMLSALAQSVPAGSEEAAVTELALSALPPYEITNDSTKPRYAEVSAFGFTQEPPAAAADGLTLSKDYFDLKGKALTPPLALKPHERIVVRLSGRITSPLSGRALLRDGLPSGSEGSLGNGLSNDLVQQLCPNGVSFPQSEELSESEYLGVFYLSSGRSFCRLYLLRAGFEGEMSALPAVINLEDSPAVRALSGALQNAIKVQAAGK